MDNNCDVKHENGMVAKDIVTIYKEQFNINEEIKQLRRSNKIYYYEKNDSVNIIIIFLQMRSKSGGGVNSTLWQPFSPFFLANKNDKQLKERILDKKVKITLLLENKEVFKKFQLKNIKINNIDENTNYLYILKRLGMESYILKEQSFVESEENNNYNKIYCLEHTFNNKKITNLIKSKNNNISNLENTIFDFGNKSDILPFIFNYIFCKENNIDYKLKLQETTYNNLENLGINISSNKLIEYLNKIIEADYNQTITLLNYFNEHKQNIDNPYIISEPDSITYTYDMDEDISDKFQKRDKYRNNPRLKNNKLKSYNKNPKCQICDYSIECAIEVAHIFPQNQISNMDVDKVKKIALQCNLPILNNNLNNKLKDINNYKQFFSEYGENALFLCKNHHALYDYDHIDIDLEGNIIWNKEPKEEFIKLNDITDGNKEMIKLKKEYSKNKE